jgi:hypothetical protein
VQNAGIESTFVQNKTGVMPSLILQATDLKIVFLKPQLA